MRNAYEAAGYTPRHQIRYLELRRRLEAERPTFVAEALGRLRERGADAEVDDTGMFVFAGGKRAAFFVIHCVDAACGWLQWPMRLDKLMEDPDFTAEAIIVQRLTQANDATLDYYILPRTAFPQALRGFDRQNAGRLAMYRHDALQAPVFT